MDHDRRRGAARGRDLVLVVPAPVVEAALAREQARVALRVVVHEEQHLAAQVGALEVVPRVLGGDDPVADEDDLGVVDPRLLLAAVAPGDVVVREPQRRLVLAARHAQLARGLRADADELDRLLPRAALGTRLEADRLEARGDVLARELVAARAGCAPLEEVAREEADVGAPAALAHALRGLALVLGQQGGPDDRQRRGGQGGERTGEHQPHGSSSYFSLDEHQVTCHIIACNRA